MRKLVIFTFMLIFASSAVISTAWAQPCAQNSSMMMLMNTDQADTQTKPCHDSKPQKKQSHCNGLCLCLHASVSQSLAQDTGYLFTPILSSGPLWGADEALTPTALSPPRRPPKLIS